MLKVLVYGGTGSQARPTVKHLLQNRHQPIVLTRNPGSATDLAAKGAKLIAGDINDPDVLIPVHQNMDAVAFLVPAFIGSSDEAVTLGKNAIDAAANSGVKRFIWNASGPIPDDINSDDPKRVIFNYLEKSSLDWAVFEPTTYMENWLGPWTEPSVKNKNELTYPVLDHIRIGWLASEDVGKLVVAATEQQDISRQRFEISGIEAPVGPELAKIYSQVLGRDIRYRAMTPEEMGAIIDQVYGVGSGDRIAELYRQEQADPNPEPKYHDMTEVLETFPVQMTNIEAWVRKHAEVLS